MLYEQLQNRLTQLESRAHLIPVYMKKGKFFLGKNPYTKQMLDKTLVEIEETKAAIEGISAWKKNQGAKLERSVATKVKSRNKTAAK